MNREIKIQNKNRKAKHFQEAVRQNKIHVFRDTQG